MMVSMVVRVVMYDRNSVVMVLVLVMIIMVIMMGMIIL